MPLLFHRLPTKAVCQKVRHTLPSPSSNWYSKHSPRDSGAAPCQAQWELNQTFQNKASTQRQMQRKAMQCTLFNALIFTCVWASRNLPHGGQSVWASHFRVAVHFPNLDDVCFTNAPWEHPNSDRVDSWRLQCHCLSELNELAYNTQPLVNTCQQNAGDDCQRQ